ncbi:DUF1102 domain-containing protein [Halomicroarcula sp. F13]|uniref:DUF1102 domain-containing protein n=1 Tax=Haloarcula rubra TaxID=2487747 RepID=A0AAW4PMN5_9EURY|nr:DUF1102 domain-containing protein [Halomicroarcula rubra]MBX0322293.1 DUF1102 domain-containing protein [Halomicroarcula rubra]
MGLGGLAASSAAAVGTGAFTSASADRELSVTVTDEASAYLALEPADDENANLAATTSDANGNQLQIDVNGQFPEAASGDGVNRSSVYEFDDMFRVANQGTQEVNVWFDEPSYGGPVDVEFYAFGQSSIALDGTDGQVAVAVGEEVKIGLKIDTGDASTADAFEDSTTVHAQASDTGASSTVDASSYAPNT